MYIKVIPICWQWQQSCSSERDALFSLVLQGNEYWAYEVSATVRWLTLSQTQAGHIWGYVLCMLYRIPIRNIYNIIYIIYDISYIISYNMMACDSLNPGTTTNKGFPSSGLHTSSCLSSSGRLRFQKLVSRPPIGC